MFSLSEYGPQADRYAALAAAATSDEERDLYLSMEKSWRQFADAARRIVLVRERNKSAVLRPVPSPKTATRAPAVPTKA